MKHIRQGDKVTLEMTVDEWERMLLMIGQAAGRAHRDGDTPMFWAWMRFANEVNRGNFNFTPHEIPEEFR